MAALSGARAQDVWGGGFPDDNVNTASNWIGGVVPPGYTADTDILVFNSSSNPYMNLNVAGIDFKGIQFQDTGDGADAAIYGANALTIGSNGISMDSVEDSMSLSVATDLHLGADQTWSPGPNGEIRVSGMISGTALLTFAGGNGSYYELDNGANSFSGGLTVTGDGTVLVVGGTGSPFGTGALSLADGVWLQPRYNGTVVLPNAVTFGDSTTGDTVLLGNDDENAPAPGALTFNGNATFKVNGTDSSDSEIDLFPNTTVILNGSLNGATPGVCIDIGTDSFTDNDLTNFNSVAILRGDFGSNVSRFDLEDNISVILDGNPTTQTSNVSNIGVPDGTYLGLGAGYIGHVAAFLASGNIDQSNFTGTLGFDNTTGGTSTFGDDIDMTNFDSDSQFPGLGSATKAILTGFITPPGGLALQFGTNYLFGGGGGHLQVTSALTDSFWYDGEEFDDEPNSLYLSPGNGPLTLQLSGTLSYTGGTYVDGAVLVFDTTVPTAGGIFLGERKDSPGYVGVTANSQFIFNGEGGAGTLPQDFVNMIDTESSGVVGFEQGTVTGNLDVHSLPGIYLGTSTTVLFNGAIIPYSGEFKFAGVKGGVVTVNSTSLETGSSDSVTIGLPTPIESFGSVSQVIMLGDNYYSGGTTLNSGYLYVNTYNSIGTGNLTVLGPTTGNNDTVGLAPSGTSVQLGNNIVLENDLTRLNYVGSPYTLTLTGNISNPEDEGALAVDGPVELDGNNTFEGGVTVNGTTLTIGNDNALSDSSFLRATAGSTINFTTGGPDVFDLDIAGTTVNFSFAGGSPTIDDLSMAAGSQITFAAGSTPTIVGLNSDQPGDGNMITLGANTALTFDLEIDPDYHGVFAGPSTSSITIESGTLNLLSASPAYSGSLNVQSEATLIASNNMAFGTGPVTIQENGTLITNKGVTVSNPITLIDGSLLAGFGTFAPSGGVMIQNGSAIVPGAGYLSVDSNMNAIPAVGTLSFGASTPLTLGTDGIYLFSMADATGAAGTGYSTVSAGGGLSITSTSIDPFVIEILSFAPGSNEPFENNTANFNNANGYAWTLVSSPTAITGFNASNFIVDTSGFLNPIGIGGFYVTDTGNDLVLNFSPVPEPSTWALMGGGVALVATLAWRRRSRPAATVV